MTVEQSDYSTLSLFVLKLGPTVTENSLYTYLCENLGIRVKSIRICRTHDRTPLGHGYINCFDAAQKELLKDKFDGHLLEGGQRVRVIDVIKDPKARKDELKHANVFIQNLPIGIQVPQLEQYLSEWGHIVSTKIAAPKPGKNSVVAYVQFGSQAIANTVIEQAQRGFITIGNMYISAAPYLPYEQRVQNKNEEFTNLYVKNLPEDVMSDNDLRALFSPYGPVKSVRLGDTSLGRRFGFVDFETCKDAKTALKGMNGIVVRSGSKPLYVARFMSKSERQTQTADPYCYPPYLTRPVPQHMSREGRNIYVKHLAPDVDEMTLLSIFQNCGPVESVKIMREQNSGASRGFGFVCYAYPDSAAAAINCMQGYQLNGARLYVSMSKPAKETRYRRSARSARELMQVWQPVYEEPAMMDHPMPTNKAFLQVNPIHKTLSI